MHRRTFIKSLLATGGAVLLGGTVYAYQSSIIDISRQLIVLPNLIQRLRIVVMSDLHMPSFYAPPGQLVKLINSESPDIFILAGDTIDKRGNECFVEIFKAVKARFAKLATLGNWEYLGKIDLMKLKNAYKNAGISLLVNATVEIQNLMIVGLDDFVLGSPDYKIVNNLSTSQGHSLVVSHCPGIFDRLTTLSENPLIVLSGHTHGGQIAPFWIVLHTPEGSGSYIQGWYHKGKHSMYVTTGIGTTPGLPIRIGAKPELLVLDLLPISL